MPVKRSLSLAQDDEDRRVKFPPSGVPPSRFCESCSTVALPVLSKTLTPETRKGNLKSHRQRIGNIVSAIEAEDTCTLCKFFVETTQIRSSDGSFQIYGSLEGPQNNIYLICDQDSWFHKIGVSANVSSCPFAWLQVGSDDNQPLICVTQQCEIPQKSPRPVAHRLYPVQRNLLEAFNGSADMKSIKRWLDKCMEHHKRCRRSYHTQLPELTVIDVRTRQLVSYTTGDRYVALSYVWGRDAMQQAVLFRDALRTSRAVQIPGEGPILPFKLPQTIEDALVVAGYLEVKYLWVDLFCIDQTNDIEKQEQIEAMDQVYAAAWLTIVSVDGPTADYGLPGISRCLSQTRQPKVQTPFGRLMATYVHSLWEHNGSSEWDLRAWTLQERLLSRRCLFFANAYYAMSCKEEEFHDLVNLNVEMPEIHLKKKELYFREDGSSINLDLDKWSFEEYGNLVSVFTGRRITDQNDIQNACWGSLNRLTSRMGVQFHHGLPKRHGVMLDSLLWMPHHKHILKRRSGFPSWSWLGWIGRSEFAYWLHFQHTDDCPHNLSVEHRRRKEKSQFLALNGRIEATIVHDHQLTAPVIQLQTKTRSFEIRHLRTSGVLYHPSFSKPEEESIGDHWALLKYDKSKLVNKVGEYQEFEDTTTSFRLDSVESNKLMKQKQKADLIFIKYWPYIWDTKKPLYHLVSALVVLKDKNGSYSRLASVTIPADEWLSADLHEITATLI